MPSDFFVEDANGFRRSDPGDPVLADGSAQPLRSASDRDRWPRLFPCSNRWLTPRRFRPTIHRFFFKPQAVVFPGPVEIDGSASHRPKSAFHADRADVDVAE